MEPQPEGGFIVSFPDVPEAITKGDTAGQARVRADAARVATMSFYTEDAKPPRMPSAAHGRPVGGVGVPLLWFAWRRSGVCV